MNLKNLELCLAPGKKGLTMKKKIVQCPLNKMERIIRSLWAPLQLTLFLPAPALLKPTRFSELFYEIFAIIILIFYSLKY